MPDPFADPMAIGGNDEDDNAADAGAEHQGFVSSRYAIQISRPIASLHSPFAQAYAVDIKNKAVDEGEAYALVFDRRFPVRSHAVTALQKTDNNFLVRVLDAGKIKIKEGERFAAIVERPLGKPLSEIVTAQQTFDERRIREEIVRPLSSVLTELHDQGVCHGGINPGKIFYDAATRQITVGECISEFCGYSQMPAFESLNRLLCSTDAKGAQDYPADYYALGVLSIYLLTGAMPFSGRKQEEILEQRLRQGSLDSTLGVHPDGKATYHLSMSMQQLARGMLTDSEKDRWQNDEISGWLRHKDEPMVPPSRVHRETTTPFVFSGTEFFGRKHLAHAIFTQWAKSRTLIKIDEVARWVKLAVKLPKISDTIESLESKGEMVLPDEKLSRLIHVLDPDGPVRYQGQAINIWGVGSRLAHVYIQSNREGLQALGAMFTLGLFEHWISVQPDPGDYAFSNLLWTPFQVTHMIRKATVGFGMERCLYMLNPEMSCQSPTIERYYATSLRAVLMALEEIGREKQDKIDPLDRHSAAYIANRVDLSDEIRVKSISKYPALARNPQVAMLALLTVAQGEARLPVLKGLTGWMKARLMSVTETFHNPRIRREFITALDKASKSGTLNDLFKVLSNAKYIRRDQAGFIEAKKQYRILTRKVLTLAKQSHVEQVAYQYGLRISVMFSYFVLVVTLLLIVIRSA